MNVTGFWATLLGVTRYEFAMQVRRVAVWVTLGAIVVLFFGLRPDFFAVPDAALPRVMANWAMIVNLVLPVGFGALLADRLPREQRTSMDELNAALPVSIGIRLWGKYFGATLATMLPIFVLYVVGVTHIVLVRHDPAAIPLAAVAFVVINLPGLLFVASFSVTCPAVLWVPLYQFLFIGYWFWGNFIPPQLIPSLSQTWINPSGYNALRGFFHQGYGATINATWPGRFMDGVGSITLMLVLAAGALVVATRYLVWRVERT